jgi:hypothetical protein
MWNYFSNSVVHEINVLLEEHGIKVIGTAYVHTSVNPADKPSRIQWRQLEKQYQSVQLRVGDQSIWSLLRDSSVGNEETHMQVIANALHTSSLPIESELFLVSSPVDS